LWVIHVIAAIPACPVGPESRHSANACVYDSGQRSDPWKRLDGAKLGRHGGMKPVGRASGREGMDERARSSRAGPQFCIIGH